MKWYETSEGIQKRNETYKRKFKEKYGVENPQQLKEVTQKMIETCNKKYGGIGFASKELEEKSRSVMEKRYGDRNIMKTEQGKKYFRGDKNPLRNPISAKKLSETKKEYYKNNPHHHKGKSYSEIMGEERAAERIEELRISGAIGQSLTPRISAPQLKLYEEVLKEYPTAVLEYPVQGFCLDIAVPELKLGFEYDGEYWHQDKEKDKKRDEILNELGWKITHISE